MQWLVLFLRAQKCQEHLVHIGTHLFCHLEISVREIDQGVLCHCALCREQVQEGFADFSLSLGFRIPNTQIPWSERWGGSSWPSGEDHEGRYPQDLQGWAWAASLFMESEAVACGGADTTTFTSWWPLRGAACSGLGGGSWGCWQHRVPIFLAT